MSAASKSPLPPAPARATTISGGGSKKLQVISFFVFLFVHLFIKCLCADFIIFSGALFLVYF